MSDVSFTPTGPPETVLPDPDPGLVAALASADFPTSLDVIVATHPGSPHAWAALGAAREAESDGLAGAVAAYAAYRVGYHRGLDALRASGWRGSGYVRSTHPSNRGFLDCLDGLGRMAAHLGETAEAERCAQFLEQLDPGAQR